MKTLTSIAKHSDCIEENYNSSMTKWNLHRLRIAFGKQPLEKWMFVPCDEDGNVLTDNCKQCNNNCKCLDRIKYQQAKERCLFEGFELIIKPNGNKYIQRNETIVFYNTENDNGIWRVSKKFITIEDITKYNLQLTQTAIKQLSL